MAFTKQPSEVLDYDIDMGKWFRGLIGDDIETVEYNVTSYSEDVPTLEVGPLPHDAITLMGQNSTLFKTWIGGGTNNTDYKITFLVTTEQDRKKEIELTIKVRDK